MLNMANITSRIVSSLIQLFFGAGLALAIAYSPGLAQNAYDRGTPAEFKAGISSPSTYAPDKIETVNLTNRNLSVNIPLVTIGARGSAGYTLTLSNNSKVWSPQHNAEVIYDPIGNQTTTIHHYSATYDDGVGRRPNVFMLGGGWAIAKGPAIKRTKVNIDPIGNNPNKYGYKYVLTKVWVVLPDGSEVEMRDSATEGAPALTPPPLVDGGPRPEFDRDRGRVWHSTDGSAITYITDTDNGVVAGQLTGWVFLADGARLRMMSGGGSARCAQITDRNGNYITIGYDQPAVGNVTYTDQLGRQVIVGSSSGTTTITIKGYNGLADRVISVETGSVAGTDGSGNPINLRSDFWSVQRPILAGDFYLDYYQGPVEHIYPGPHTDLFSECEGTEDMSNSRAVTRLNLLDGSSFHFRYNPYGELAEIVYPGGGVSQIDYTAFGAGGICAAGTGPLATQINRGVSQRRSLTNGVTVDTVWTYPHSFELVDGVYYPTVTVEAREGSPTGTLLLSEKHFFLNGGVYRTCSVLHGSIVANGTEYETFGLGREFRVERQTGAGTEVVIRTWQQRAPVVWAPDPGSSVNSYAVEHGQQQPPNDPRVTREDAILDNGKLKRVEYEYDDFNNVTLVREYDYGTNPNPGPLIRETARSYATSLNGSCYSNLNPSDPGCGDGITADINSIIHQRRLMLQESIWDKTTNQEQARTTYEYDVYADDGNHATLVDYASVTGHDTAWGAARAARGNVTQVGNWLKESNTYLYAYPRYDEVGHVVATKDPRGAVSSVSFADDFGDGENPGSGMAGIFGATYAFPTLFTSASPNPSEAPHTARAQYDFNRGTQTGFKDNNNIITKTEYNDPINRPTRIINAKGVTGVETQTAIYYAPQSNPYGVALARNEVLTAKDRDAAGDGILRSWTVTDGFGRTIEGWTRHPQGDVKVTTVYDGMGRVSQTSNPHRNGETPVYTTTTYDLAGRVIAFVTPDNATVSTTHNGAQVTVTDQAGKRRRSETDGLGRLIRVTEDPDNLNYDTYYSYDALDNLRLVTQGSQTRTFVYDSLSRLISATNPESGTMTYAYDPNGNLIEKTDARGVRTTMTYDALNRARSKVYSGTTPEGTGAANATSPVNYFYDDCSGLPSGAPCWPGTPSKGRLVGVTYGPGSEGTYCKYDAGGRIVTNHQRMGTSNYATAYFYNRAGALTREERGIPARRRILMSYDAGGRLATMDTGSYPFLTYVPLVGNISYTPFGGLQSETYGNGLIHSIGYNNRLQPTEIRLGRPDNLESVFTIYSIYGTANNVNDQDAEITDAHNNGNIARIRYSVSGTIQYTQTFQYDPLNRLRYAVEHNNGTYNDGARAWYQTFDYDRYGNRGINVANTSDNVDAANSALQLADFSGANNRITRVDFIYDAAGNLIAEPGKSYTYDAENRIVTATMAGGATSQYVYDGNGRRMKKIVGGVATRFEYGAGGELISERNDSNGNVIKDYFYKGGGVLATSKVGNSGEYEYATADHLGSPRAWTDGSGNLTTGGRHDYAPFGEELSAGVGIRSASNGYSGDSVRQKFGSKEHDIETGFDYFIARYYSSVQGRFTSVDPGNAGAEMEYPQAWNGYSYAINNPLTYSDPDGLKVKVCDSNGNCTEISDADATKYLFNNKYQQQSGYRLDGKGGVFDTGGNKIGTYQRTSSDDLSAEANAFIFGRGGMIDQSRRAKPIVEAVGAVAALVVATPYIGLQTATLVGADLYDNGGKPSVNTAIVLASGIVPPLKSLHGPEVYESGLAKGSLEYWRKQPTEKIIESLKPGQTEPLITKPDGTIMQGNTRVKVLRERGVDVNSLPRTPK